MCIRDRVSCRNVWNVAQGLKFKADFHSKMGVCRHELGRVHPPPPDNSNPGGIVKRQPAYHFCGRWSNVFSIYFIQRNFDDMHHTDNAQKLCFSFCIFYSAPSVRFNNNGHSNLAKEGDIVRLKMTSATAHSLSISSIIFARWQHSSWSWSWGYILDPNFGGKRRP